MSLDELKVNLIPQVTQAQTGDPDIDEVLTGFVIDNSNFVSPADPTCNYQLNSCGQGCSAVVDMIQNLIQSTLQQNPIMFDMGAEADFICP
jgi:hypothetical protein